MRQKRGFESRLDPTPEQARAFAQWCGVSKAVYNYALRACRDSYASWKVHRALLAFRAGDASYLGSIYDLKEVLGALGWSVDTEPDKDYSGAARTWTFSQGDFRIELRPSVEGINTRKNKQGKEKPNGVKTETAIRALQEYPAFMSQVLAYLNLPAYEAGEAPIKNPVRILTAKNLAEDGLSVLRRDLPFIREAPARVAHEALDQVDAAFKNMKKTGAGYPRFKDRGSTPRCRMSPGGAKKVCPKCKDTRAVSKEACRTCQISIEAIPGLTAAEQGGEYIEQPKDHLTKKVSEKAYVYQNGPIDVTRKTITFPFPQGYKGEKLVKLSRHGYIPMTGKGHGVKYSQVAIYNKGGHWHVSVQVEWDAPDPKPRKGGISGIDVGGSQFMIVSNPNAGTPGAHRYPDRPVALTRAYDKIKRYERKLRILNRHWSRQVGPVVTSPDGEVQLDSKGKAVRQKASKRWYKTRDQIRKVQGHLSAITGDLRHQMTARIVRNGASEYRVENLGLRASKHEGELGLMEKSPTGTPRDKKMRLMWRKIGAGEMHRQIAYKAEWNGATSSKVESYYTSKQCHCCGTINLRFPSSERLFRCINPSCGFGVTWGLDVPEGGNLPLCHRDSNAALVIANPDPRLAALREAAWQERALRIGESQLGRRSANADPSGATSIPQPTTPPQESAACGHLSERN